ncbi:MAG: hypothetical protein KGZ83_11565 [Sulfuricella sp.]|nr:hypothetical protein [Sulfuricella sp.]
MPFHLQVISQQPPGGRCTLYARYAAELSSCFGAALDIVYTDCRDAHGAGFPSLLLNGMALQPGDGVILSPHDLVTALAGFNPAPDLLQRLQTIEDKLLQEA